MESVAVVIVMEDMSAVRKKRIVFFFSFFLPFFPSSPFYSLFFVLSRFARVVWCKVESMDKYIGIARIGNYASFPSSLV